MQYIYLDAKDYRTAQEVHAALKRLLNLPDYYGMNADALADCLGERREQPVFCLRRGGNDEVETTLDKVCRVAEDLGGQIRAF